MPSSFNITRAWVGIRNPASWYKIFRDTLHEFDENDLFTSAAAMSYFGLLALFPALLLLLSLSNLLVAGSPLLNQLIVRVVQNYPASAEFLRGVLDSLEKVGWGVIVSCLVVMLWAGSWVFAVIERALNRIWHCSSRTFLHGRGTAVAMIGATGMVLATSTFITSILVILQRIVDDMTPDALARFHVLTTVGGAFWQVITLIAGMIINIVLFTLIYRFMPNAKVRLRETFQGAIFAGLLWEAAKYIFAVSLHYFHYDELYGSVGAVVAVLTWGYVSSLILLFGAQLSAVLQERHGAARLSQTNTPSEEQTEEIVADVKFAQNDDH